MDTVNVVVENWPKADLIIEYIPLLIALIALAVSLYSVYLTRRSFIASHRPYVWASSYAVIKDDVLQPIPWRLAYRVANAPAKIWQCDVRIDRDDEPLLSHSDTNFVRFPDDRSEWTFGVGDDEFSGLMSGSVEGQAKLRRVVSITYSSLDGSQTYHYELQQIFRPADNQWVNTAEEAD